MNYFYELRKHRKLYNASKIITTFLFIFLALYSVYAYSSGKTGSTANGCTCHGSQSSNTTLSVTSQSGSFTVQPGATETFTVTVSNSGYSYAGVDIAVKTTSSGETDAGMLTPESGSGLQASNGELTHTTPKSYSGSCQFTFTWTAPMTPGTYYLRAVGNAVNNNGGSSGDQWNFMTTQQITVPSPPTVTVTAPNGGEGWCAGSSQNITWTSSSVSNVKIELSTDGGSSFPTVLADNVSAAAGSWSWNISAGQEVGSTFKVRLSDASNSNINDASNANFSVGSTTLISAHPQNLTACTGNQAQFTVGASGANLTYKWRKGGVDIANSNVATYTIANVNEQSAGSYSCVVTGACGPSVTSNAATLSVDITPNVTVQPVNQTKCEGEAVNLSITAVGTEISYQWRKNGTNIDGATQNTYAIASAASTDAGSYDCVVSGKCSPPKTSQAAVVVVNSPAQIVTQPDDVIACEGKKAVLWTKASGSGLIYLWKKDGVAVANSNNDTLTFAAVKPIDAGSYTVSISSTCGSETVSRSVNLSINPLPSISAQLENQNVNEGANFSITVQSIGTGLRYQWRKGTTNIAGQTSKTLSINQVKLSDSGSYDCIVTNDCGSVTSNQFKLSVKASGPGPIVSLSMSSLDFGNVFVGQTKDTVLTGIIKNTGTEALNLTKVFVDGVDKIDFILQMQAPVTLAPGESINAGLRFSTLNPGAKSAHIEIESNAPSNPKLDIIAFGASAKLLLSNTELTVIADKAGSSGEGTLNIKNEGNVDVNLELSLNGADASLFKISSPTTISIKAQSSVDIKLQYNPTASNEALANLAIKTIETGETSTVALHGKLATSVEELSNELSFRAFPNPVTNKINIEFNLLAPEAYTLNIYNLNGEKVRIISGNGNTGTNQVNWDGTNQSGEISPAGRYQAMLSISKGTVSYPIILQR